MELTTLKFIVFFSLTTLLYYISPSTIYKRCILILGSTIYLLTFGWKSVLVLISNAITAFGVGVLLDKVTQQSLRKAILAIGILSEVLMLALLKYITPTLFNHESVVIPIGISFYSLALIGYIADVFMKKIQIKKDLIDFLTFAMYFPHVLQGPIPRYQSFVKSLHQGVDSSLTYTRISYGAQLMLWGFIKKMVIADRLSIFVDSVYQNYDTARGTTLFFASLMYTIQIYADFSGCVDISFGMSDILGIKLQPNFQQPYLAKSIKDFWRRWHISLSNWLKDYIYIPLGGNRLGRVRKWINILIVYAFSGLWHGVGLSFLAWGLLHGAYQIIGELLGPIKKRAIALFQFREDRTAFSVLQIGITLFFVSLGWIIFRINSIKTAFEVYKSIFLDISPWILTDGTLYQYGVSANQWHALFIFVLLMVAVDLLHESSINIRQKIANQHLFVRWTIYFLGIISVFIFGAYGIGYDAASFIYMNF